MERVLLNVKRYKQRPSECAIASTAALAHYFEPSIDYKSVREIVIKNKMGYTGEFQDIKSGLYTTEQARALNQLGFGNVTIVTADLNLIDFSWCKYSKKSIVRRMKKLRAYYRRQKDEDNRHYVNDMIKWLEDDRYDNNVVIDYEFKKYIKKQLDKGIPVGAAINWTSLFKFSKGNRRQNGDIEGVAEDHSIILRGYDAKGVFVVDSHHKFYTGKRAKFKNGYYKLPWDKFLVNIPSGDLILV